MGATAREMEQRLQAVGLKKGRDFADFEFRDGASSHISRPFAPAGNFVTLKGLKLATPPERILYKQEGEPPRSVSMMIQGDEAFQRAQAALRRAFSEWGGVGYKIGLPAELTLSGSEPVSACAPVHSRSQRFVEAFRWMLKVITPD
jgi:hypothetical protein